MERKIYNLNSGTIEVYSYLPNQAEQMRYRREQMDLIPYSERVLVEKEPVSWFTRTEDVVYSCPAFSLRKGETRKTKVRESLSNGEFLRRYHRGDFMDSPVYTRLDKDGEEFIYLAPFNDTSDKKIQLTSGLLVDYLLYNEEFTSVRLDTDLSRFRCMYKISDEPLFRIDADDLERTFISGLVSGDFFETMNYVECATKVYRKLK